MVNALVKKQVIIFHLIKLYSQILDGMCTSYPASALWVVVSLENSSQELFVRVMKTSLIKT